MRKVICILVMFFVCGQIMAQSEPCSVAIIPQDTTITATTAQSVQLSTDMQATYYHWIGQGLSNTTIANPIATVQPGTTQQYILEAMFLIDSNLVYNGDFEAGNTGFTTGLIYSNASTLPPYGYYNIVSNTNLAYYFASCTHNGGNMMVVDGATSANVSVFETQVAVQTNTEYNFSYEATEISTYQYTGGALARFKVFVNNVQVGELDTLTSQPCDWLHFTRQINSGTNTTLTIKIVDDNIVGPGNDYAIDNISLKAYCTARDTVNITVNLPDIIMDTITDYLCSGDTYTNYGLSVNIQGYYTVIDSADSNHHLVINLIEAQPFLDSIYAQIYRGETYSLNGFNEREEGTYTQNFQTVYGCDSTYILTLKVICLMFPNVVTANGDGINDVFEIHDLLAQSLLSENEIIIFSRQGNKVYEHKNIKTKEDFWSPAKTNSPDGTYFYRFKAKGKTKTIEQNG